jgi:hypothetical protein
MMNWQVRLEMGIGVASSCAVDLPSKEQIWGHVRFCMIPEYHTKGAEKSKGKYIQSNGP